MRGRGCVSGMVQWLVSLCLMEQLKSNSLLVASDSSEESKRISINEFLKIEEQL